ncbi:6-phosphofructo-2-kinase [Lecanora helva]
MPLLGNGEYREPLELDQPPQGSKDPTFRALPVRKQSQHSATARIAMNNHSAPVSDCAGSFEQGCPVKKEVDPISSGSHSFEGNLTAPANSTRGPVINGASLTDTPSTTASNSPTILPRRRDSGTSTPSRNRPTTLDIPGLTKSKVSPDGKIAQRDVGSKLVIVMVGLPARGKSYITKKVARYLNWLQHDTRIFNVGERRRVAAGSQSVPPTGTLPEASGQDTNASTTFPNGVSKNGHPEPQSSPPTRILVNGEPPPNTPPLDLPMAALDVSDHEHDQLPGEPKLSNGHAHEERLMPEQIKPRLGRTESAERMEQKASFFDPNNEKAAHIRDEIAMGTLDELLDFILDQGGSVGIFDATNSTLERRKLVMDKIRQRAGPELNVLFLESLCIDETLLESNMRLKLSGPDYKDQDPVTALEDFKKRVELYQQKYVPMGEYEEKHNMPYVQMIDVGRKVVSHQIKGFLSAQTVYYLLNFNLAPRQIWITRHGESLDNVNGKIGGDSDLSGTGHAYARALTKFIKYQRELWEIHQKDKALSTHFPPQPGDTTPPNPSYDHGDENSSEGAETMNFCVWTSMLKRSIQTAQYFDEEEFDVKQMKMLDELNSGIMEGLTYQEIMTKHKDEYERRKKDKLHYRYPGAGGEGYLDIINRLRAVIVEVERMTDHVLLVGHRSVARVLLAYFKGLKRDDVADLDVPLGMLYMLEPKPYGVEFKAYRYNMETDWFEHVPNYQLRRAPHLSH